MSKFWHERTNETEHCWMHSFASRALLAAGWFGSGTSLTI